MALTRALKKRRTSSFSILEVEPSMSVCLPSTMEFLKLWQLLETPILEVKILTTTWLITASVCSRERTKDVEISPRALEPCDD